MGNRGADARDAGSSYVLTLVVPASRFQRTIDNQRLPPQWSPVILDQNWTIVARGMTPEKFIGQTGASYELKDTPGIGLGESNDT
jgi:hypothetical protein